MRIHTPSHTRLHVPNFRITGVAYTSVSALCRDIVMISSAKIMSAIDRARALSLMADS